MGSHLQHSAHSDTHRLTSPNPKMILSTYEIDLHPAVRDTGHTVVVVEHNMSLVMGVCDQVVVMDAGSVIAAGPPQAVQNDPLVISAYFGAAEANT